ncbi:hypothetical protein AADG42_11515 [Ammonicoccus fulvus]|uniref:SMI1/KNR4 family protein n=1 Tax=Ammonicoccus fulvus TaxID=3138240 RepID=A0ABZ3FSW1_9ACTN
MSYDIFIMPGARDEFDSSDEFDAPDADGVLSETPLFDELMQLLPNATNAFGDSIDFRWSDGSAGGTVYGATETPCRSLMINRPGETTIDFFAALCAERGWRLVDGEGELDVFEPGSSASVRLRAGEDPFQQIGEPGWAERTREWLVLRVDDHPVPHSPAALAAAEERIGQPLPPLLRTWFGEIGDVAYRSLDGVCRFAETPAYAERSPEERTRWSDALALMPEGVEIIEAQPPHTTFDLTGRPPVQRTLQEHLRWTLDQY